MTEAVATALPASPVQSVQLTSEPPFGCSPSISKILAALAKAQAAFPAIDKGRTAKIATKAGTSYSYTYADLADVFAAIRAPLGDHGLCLFQPVRIAGRVVGIRTVLGHESGEYLASDELTMPIGDANDPRSVASAITYGRRYAALSMLGIAPADEDDDAEAASVPQRGKQQAKPARQPRAESGPEAGQAAADDTRNVTKEQVDRLKAVMKEHNVDKAMFTGYLKETYGYESWSAIERRNYDNVVQLAQSGAYGPAPVQS